MRRAPSGWGLRQTMESPYKGKTGLRRVWNALTYSLDGVFPTAGVQAFYEVLRSFDPMVKDASGFNVQQTYDNSFVKK